MLALPLQWLWCKWSLGNFCELPSTQDWWGMRLEFDLSLWWSEQIGIYTRSSHFNSQIECGPGPERSSWPCAYVKQCLHYSLSHLKTPFTRWKKATIEYLIMYTVSQIIHPITFIFRKISSNMSMITELWCSLECIPTLVRGIQPSQSSHAKFLLDSFAWYFQLLRQAH